MRVLLDTNVLSETKRPVPNPAVLARLASTPAQDKFVSVITIGEIAAGTAKLEPGKRRRELEEWLAYAERNFADRLLPVDRDVAHLWGDLTARVTKAGHTLHPADGLIAATALHNGLHLMTRNVTDFEPTGVQIINPWEGA
jgi:predicted nucleic acid-binding protein